MTYYALDFPRPVYDYDGAGNAIAYDDYVEDDYAVGDRRNEGHDGRGGYNADVYAS